MYECVTAIAAAPLEGERQHDNDINSQLLKIMHSVYTNSIFLLWMLYAMWIVFCSCISYLIGTHEMFNEYVYLYNFNVLPTSVSLQHE